MSKAVVTGGADLGNLEYTSSDSVALFSAPINGSFLINGVRVPLAAVSADHVVKTINRFTSLTNVTASIAGSTVSSSDAPKVKRLALTSPEEIRVAGDMTVMSALGIEGGVTAVSTAHAADSADATTYGSTSSTYGSTARGSQYSTSGQTTAYGSGQTSASGTSSAYYGE